MCTSLQFVALLQFVASTSTIGIGAKISNAESSKLNFNDDKITRIKIPRGRNVPEVQIVAQPQPQPNVEIKPKLQLPINGNNLKNGYSLYTEKISDPQLPRVAAMETTSDRGKQPMSLTSGPQSSMYEFLSSTTTVAESTTQFPVTTDSNSKYSHGIIDVSMETSVAPLSPIGHEISTPNVITKIGLQSTVEKPLFSNRVSANSDQTSNDLRDHFNRYQESSSKQSHIPVGPMHSPSFHNNLSPSVVTELLIGYEKEKLKIQKYLLSLAQSKKIHREDIDDFQTKPESGVNSINLDLSPINRSPINASPMTPTKPEASPTSDFTEFLSDRISSVEPEVLLKDSDNLKLPFPHGYKSTAISGSYQDVSDLPRLETLFTTVNPYLGLVRNPMTSHYYKHLNNGTKTYVQPSNVQSILNNWPTNKFATNQNKLFLPSPVAANPSTFNAATPQHLLNDQFQSISFPENKDKIPEFIRSLLTSHRNSALGASSNPLHYNSLTTNVQKSPTTNEPWKSLSASGLSSHLENPNRLGVPDGTVSPYDLDRKLIEMLGFTETSPPTQTVGAIENLDVNRYNLIDLGVTTTPMPFLVEKIFGQLFSYEEVQNNPLIRALHERIQQHVQDTNASAENYAPTAVLYFLIPLLIGATLILALLGAPPLFMGGLGLFIPAFITATMLHPGQGRSYLEGKYG